MEVELFHIDRANSLNKGQQITLSTPSVLDPRCLSFIRNNFPDGISKAGQIYLSDMIVDSSADYYHRVKEIEFEYIRKLYFPQKPSRFLCFFALETARDVELWINAFNIKEKERSFTIWRILVENDRLITKHDATWRDRMCLSKSDIVYSAWENQMDGLSYWRGIMTENPRPELLIPLTKCTVTVLEPIDFL